jgi:TolB-like protein/predicted Zn-dependent protease
VIKPANILAKEQRMRATAANADELRKIEGIFHSALKCAPKELGAFLDSACGENELLRQKIEALLSSDQQATDFIEKPPTAFAARVIEDEATETDSLIGRTIGHYKITQHLGSGGMGEVYVALDTRSERKAVLKLLPARFTSDPERIKRFQHEARALVAFNHPNILTTYEIGEEESTYYIVSELIEGETLRQRLSRERLGLKEAIDITIQVASALSAAHQAGIVHCDVKPENIMLRRDGYVKVLDFGIAKLAAQELPSRIEPQEAISLVTTHVGSILGTVRYMSPEQARGERVDHRTDIWSLGVVLYEMVTGLPPFSGATPQDVISAALTSEPAPIVRQGTKVPFKLREIISRALRKDREERYDSMHEMREALQSLWHKLELSHESGGNNWLANPRRAAAIAVLILLAVSIAVFTLVHSRALRLATSAPRSIAVLPLDDRGASESDRYFAQGIQHELISQLSRIEDLKVISQGSTQRYQHGKRNPVEIAKQLGVNYLLEGSVERTGKAIRLEMHLSNPAVRAQLWTATYNRPLTDIFAVESEITTNVAGALEVRVSGDDAHAFASTPTHSSEAHELYLRGHYLAEKRDEQDVKKAIDLYEQAIEKDSTYALAYAGLAEAYVLLPGWGNETRIQRCYAIAKTAAQKAVAIDPTLPEAHIGLALAVVHQARDFTRAQEELERAIDLAPNSAYAHYLIGYLVYAAEGDLDHAIAEIKRAVELDPLSPIVNSNLGVCYLLAHRYQEGLAQLQKTQKLNPTVFFVYDHLGWALALTGHLDEAIETWKHGYSIGHHYQALAELAYGYAIKGDRDQALKVVARLRDLEQHGTRFWPLGHAYIELGLGNKQEAIAWLERGAAENDSAILSLIKTLPVLDPLRGDPRFEHLVAELVPKSSPVVEDKHGIAVLPFENLSDEKANAYFADGIQDEILTRLSKIADLKVISRTSTQRYKSSPASLREIAQQLGVGHVLEGSVQKAADKVRISVQLINATNDSHVWAETYDRKLIDTFEVESDVAQKIASMLEAKLTGQEKAAIAARGTENPQAYETYLRALALNNSQSDADNARMRDLFREAVQLDPNFAEAWSWLTVMESLRYFFPEESPAQKERARNAAETALRLAPDSADAIGSMGLYYYYVEKNYDEALRWLDRARAIAPNDWKSISATSLVKRRQGKLDETIALQERGAELDPLNVSIWMDLAWSYRGQRDFEHERAILDRALTISPNDANILAQKAETYLAAGDVEKSWQMVRDLKFGPTDNGVDIALRIVVARRDYDGAIRRITAMRESGKEPRLFQAVDRAVVGQLRFAQGGLVAAGALLHQAEGELAQLRDQHEGGMIVLDTLIQVEACLGRRDEVERIGEQLRVMRRLDKWTYPFADLCIATAYAQMGDADHAVSLLDNALHQTYAGAITPAYLRLDPRYDPIRNDPRFERLANEPGPR